MRMRIICHRPLFYLLAVNIPKAGFLEGSYALIRQPGFVLFEEAYYAAFPGLDNQAKLVRIRSPFLAGIVHCHQPLFKSH